MIAAFMNGIQLDIQFAGGSIIKYTYSSTIDPAEAEIIVEQAIGKTTDCLLQANPAKGISLYSVASAALQMIPLLFMTVSGKTNGF
jgi:hypothetical protein